MKRRTFLITGAAALGGTGILLGGCTTTRPDTPEDRAARRREIDNGADAVMTRLYSNAKGSKELAQRAEGILIFPRLLSGGLVVGGEYGDGVLRTRGSNAAAGYYRLVGGSLGWQAGAQSQAVVLMFLTRQALDSFRKSSGWTAGVDASVAVATVGASGDIDTNTAKQSVVGFALTNAGLYAGLKIDGAKITRLEA
jgi:lipid-binding SYLF domain-containing protein